MTIAASALSGRPGDRLVDDLEGVFVSINLVQDFLQFGRFFHAGPG